MTADSTAPFTMYTTSWCPFCHRLKAGLSSAGIQWREIDVEDDPDAAELVKSHNGGNRTVPTLVWEDGTAQTNPSVEDVLLKLAV